MVSDVDTLNALSKRWNGPCFWSPAIGRRGAVVILGSPRQPDNVTLWRKDAGGRLVSLLITFENVRVNLINMYAPTYPTERKIFFQSLAPFVFPNSRLVITGDFNSYDSVSDKMGGTASINKNFSELKLVNALQDAWLLKHPGEKLFTWYNSDLSIASRLDTFLISRFLCKQVISCEIRPCVYSDHDFVFLVLNLHTVNGYGLGTWKFNNSLLLEENFCTAMSDLIDHFLRFRSSFSSDLIM